MNKKELRKLALSVRKNLTVDTTYLENEVLSKIKDSKNIAIFYPMRYEINLLFLKKYNLNLIYPKVNGNSLEFYMNPTKFEKSSFGVYEPIDGIFCNKNMIDIMFVPALVISKSLYRIGYGKGYYDRYLKDRTFKAIGLCYKDLYLDFKNDIFDERLDEVIICKP